MANRPGVSATFRFNAQVNISIIHEKTKKIYSFLPEDYFDTKSKSTHLNMWMGGLNEFEQKIEGL